MKKNCLFNLTTAVIMLNACLAFGQSYRDTILADEPVSYWPLQETNGPIIYDIVGTNHGTMQVGVSTSGNGNWTAWEVNDGSAFGMRGPGVLFGEPNDAAIYFTNATATHIAIPYAPSLNTPRFSVEVWLRFPVWPLTDPVPATVDFVPLSFDYNGGTQGGWQFYLSNGKSGTQPGRLQAWCAKATHAGWNQCDPGINYSDQWIHAVMTYDGTDFKEYINGVMRATVAGGYGDVTPAPPAYWLMGGLTSGAIRQRIYQGGMSHVAIYSNALSAGQILNHYYVGTVGSALPPSIGTQPVGRTNYVGYSQTLSVAAAGTPPLRYQWYKDASPIPGATNTSLVLNNLVVTNSGDYSVTITNALGSTNSDVAFVGVLDLPANVYQAAVVSQFPQAYYPLNETEGLNAVDIINIGNNQATYIGDPILGDVGASSFLGTAVTLDGVTQGILMNNANAMNIVGNTTMEAWILIQATNFNQVIIGHGPAIPQNPSKASNTLGIKVDPETGDAFYYIERYQQTFDETNGVTCPVPAADVGNWVHLVGVADGVAWRLYHNGVEVANAPDTIGAVPANGGWAFGAVNASWANPASVVEPYLWGSINNVGIYNYALTSQIVQQHYQLGLTGVVTGPPEISIQRSGLNVTVSWTDGFLQQAESIAGPWSYSSTAVSPYTVGVTNPALFFRVTLQSPP